MFPAYDAMKTGEQFHVNKGEGASWDLDLTGEVDTVTMGHFKVIGPQGTRLRDHDFLEDGGYLLFSILGPTKVRVYARSPKTSVIIKDLTILGDRLPEMPAPEIRHSDSKGRIALSLPEGPYRVTRAGKSITVSPL